MYSEDQDEDVEEEEEFHEVEEEKHKTSQESVGSSGEQRLSPQSPTTISKTPPPPPTPTPAAPLPPQEVNHEKLEKSEHEVCNDTPRQEESQPEPSVEETCPAGEIKNTAPVSQELSQDEPKDLEAPSKDENTEAETDIGNTNASTVEPSNCIGVHTTQHRSEPRPVNDWANIMMNNAKNDSDSAEETSSSDKVVSDNGGDQQSIIVGHAEDTIDDIVHDTQEKLKITDDSNHTLESATKALADNETATLTQDAEKSAAGVGKGVDQVPHDVEVNAPAESAPTGQGEGQGEHDAANEVEKKELDLDEDVKNPQYIPKKGVFYEHDDRSHDTDEKKSSPSTTQKEDETVEVRENNANKKAPGGDKPAENRRTTRRQRTDADRWAHDMFRNEKQKPKSKSELINAYGYDIRQERGSRNSAENRAPRTNMNNSNIINSDRASGNQDVQRSRQSKDSRGPRQVQNSTNNNSRERRPRRQNAKSNRGDSSQGGPNRRDAGQAGGRPAKVDNTKDLRETLDEKHATQAAAAATARRDRDREGSASNRNVRNDSRGRRRTSRDRPNVEDSRLPPPNNVMPPITTWSSEDMMIAEAFGKKSPSNVENDENLTSNNSNNANSQRDRPLDGWEQGPPAKPIYQDRSIRNQDENRQHYSPRGRGDENHRPSQFTPRNQYHDRTQQHDWHRANNFNPYAKSNDYVVKTQTFENSRLSQANQNRSNNNRDLRDVINERRGNTQQNFQSKVQHNVEHHVNHRGHMAGHYHHQYAPTQHYMHPHHQQMVPGQSLMPHQAHQQLAMTQSQLQQPQRSQQQSPQQIPAVPNRSQQQQPQQQQPQQQQPQTQQQQNSHAQPSRQPSTTQSGQTVAGQSRQGVTENSSESIRLNSTAASDPLNSRPIVKTDAYTGAGLSGHQQHSQPLSQHSQNHRSIGGPMPQSGAVTANSHLVPSHLGGAATQPQYYQPSSGSRDPNAALASAYHGYIPSGHPVMDPSRYHMTSQQLSDHGYITPGQTSDVSGGTVMHQQGLYTDTSGAGAMANTAYLAQAGSSLSPTTNIPVTGAGSQPLAPVSYIQHSQYPPPPYSNPYPQPQMNQPPPQSGHAYPYWTYI